MVTLVWDNASCNERNQSLKKVLITRESVNPAFNWEGNECTENCVCNIADLRFGLRIKVRIQIGIVMT